MGLPLDLGLELSTLAVLVLVAFIAGFIDAIAGGGGLLTIPALLTAGLPPHIALGTNKLCATFGSATAGYTFYKRQLFNPKQWRNALWATAIGALIGAVVAHWMPSQWLNMLLPVVVFACGLYMLVAKTPDVAADADAPIKQRRQWPQGLSLGMYDGVVGPGTGAFWTVSTLLLYPLDLLRASGVARCMNFVSNACALSIFIISGKIAWLLGIAMGLALMLGSYLGARSAIRGGAKFIRPLFILMVLALTARLAWQHWLS
ncbi:TSUP family transporter [Pseudomonas sp. 5P_3.1_Bac2]|uniref:TSUP family transporter n=1 Tax=Pseudomonas sp. 5P_3.1_Bac2 TaxID=2971617 RepID=UPI0021C8926F|nr:TSUP family transporter [Pseudomonas sp. 5P_3.1_Bac2]MCU1717461.1 TSUP family transporter [Pseudomonas sp. 5P_3.1_Bac2]